MNKRAIIYLITEGNLTAENFSAESKKTLRIIKKAAQTKVSHIQIREKSLPAKFIYSLASEAVRITRNTSTKILVNDRFDIALAANADGMHLTATSLDTWVIRQKLRNHFIVGVSTHSLEKGLKAKHEGADFVTFSPVFDTISKPVYGKPKGLEKLKEVCEALAPFPVVALGGINEDNYSKVLEAGAAGFASIGFLNDEENLDKL